jgi:hypothetical protein
MKNYTPAKAESVRFVRWLLRMDTFKEKQRLDDLHVADVAPWQVWNSE